LWGARKDYHLFLKNVKLDGVVKRPQIPFSVIPVKTGIQSFQWLSCPAFGGMDSRLRGNDDFLRDYQT